MAVKIISPVMSVFLSKDKAEKCCSHVLRAIGLDESYAKGTIRVSFGKDNTVEDAEKIARYLISIISPYNT